MKNKAINSDSYEYLKSLIPNSKIIDLVVRGKWLRATIINQGTGLYFSVLN